jgi:protein-S-isoprenylcysteine O-methyltransferase Ste14
VHAAFWILVVVRSLTSRPRRAPERDDREATAPRARLILAVAAFAVAAFYGVFAASWVGVGVGPRSIPASPWSTAAGTALAGAAIGFVAWAYAVFSSFRLTAAVGYDHRLCVRGPFAIVRHPIYLAVDCLFLGSAVALPRLALLVCATAVVAAHDRRARAEERLLADVFGDDYRTYCNRTARYCPGLY